MTTVLYAIDRRRTMSLICRAGRAFAALVLGVTATNLTIAAEVYLLPNSGVIGASADGQSILVSRADGPAIWNPTANTLLPLPSADYQNLSADGSTAVGRRGSSQKWTPVRWTAESGLVDLPSPGPGGHFAAASSADGSITYGAIQKPDGTDTLVRWLADGTMTELGILDGATDLLGKFEASDNGLTLSGQVGGPDLQYGQGFHWSTDSGMTALGHLDGSDWSKAWDVSANGTTIVGWSEFNETGLPTKFVPSRWTSEGGLQSLGQLAGFDVSSAEVVSADGSLVLGPAGSYDRSDRTLFAWTEATGMVDLEPILFEQVGMSFFGGDDVYTRIVDLSNDGRTLVGFGKFLLHGQPRDGVWAVALDEPLLNYVVPEPNAAALAVLALVPLAVWRTRRVSA